MNWSTPPVIRGLGLTRTHLLALVAILALACLWIDRTGAMRDEERALKRERKALLAELRSSGDIPATTAADPDRTTDCEGANPFQVLDEISRQRQLTVESGLAADADRIKEIPARVLQLRVRGSYTALRETLRDAAGRLPCLSIDSLDLRRDKTTDPLLTADVKATLYGGVSVAEQNGGTE